MDFVARLVTRSRKQQRTPKNYSFSARFLFSFQPFMHEEGHPEPLDNSRARALFAISILFPLLASVAVAGRFYARRIKGLTLGVDDWMLLLGLVCCIEQGIGISANACQIFFYLQAITTLVGKSSRPFHACLLPMLTTL